MPRKKLMYCPLCGGEPTTSWGGFNDMVSFVIECEDCGLKFETWGEDGEGAKIMKEAHGKWNFRV